MRKNLVLVHTAEYDDLEDWNEIAGHVREMADDIEVFVVSNDATDPAVAEAIAGDPTLVFAHTILQGFQPPRGKVYQARIIPKFAELQRLSAGKVPVPPTAILTPDLKLDPRRWGEMVLVKPTAPRRGSVIGITLAPTARLRYVPPEQYPEGHPGRDGPMMVQAFIYSGPSVSHYRVLTLFGEPLYAEEKRLKVPAFNLDLLRRAPFLAHNHMAQPGMVEFRPVADKRVLRLARKAATTLPEAPLHAVDIVRQAPSGRLYVLETNPGGNSWEFSNRKARQDLRIDPDILRKRREQFDAFRTAARVLVERTRAEAC